ncbi:MAG TPA: porin [Steroidobacteraceae bacterium]|nr:porin [Steroidobacteraceae bacterium]
MQNSNKRAFRLAAAFAATLAATAAGAVDIVSGDWKFSVNGNINVDYIYSSCQSASSAERIDTVGGACTGSASGSSVSNVGNGLLPAAITFGISTTQNGYDIAAHFGLYPGIASNDSGSPNLQQNSTAFGTNVGLATTGLDVRQVYLTFGNKEIGTFTFGRNFGLFGFDAIINDMTLPGVGVGGSASTASPSNTTLGSIGFGYLYVDTLAQMDYTTPDIAGFNFTAGIFAPINPIDGTNYTARKAPGFHGKATYTLKMADDMKFYASATFITQKENSQVGTGATAVNGPAYTSTGADIFAKFDVAGFEVDASYYYGKGMGTTGLFILASDGAGNARKSDGYLIQGTYTVGAVKFGVNYGVSKLDLANAADDPFLLEKNSKVTGGIYYSLTKNLTLLGEVSGVKTQAHNGNENKSTNGNFGAFMSF